MGEVAEAVEALTTASSRITASSCITRTDLETAMLAVSLATGAIDAPCWHTAPSKASYTGMLMPRDTERADEEKATG